MKNQAKVLAILALLGASLVITGCPYGHRPHRPHIPHPHRLPHPLQPVGSLLQIDTQNNAPLAMQVAGKPATSRINN